ncbi:MAG: DNA mismatch repair endonuclease MutL [Clostridia bacterium]|nr:DNA mismatch repair endonuclease MutL [Clostridia bacterium]
MSIINLLDKSVFNRIAAGEVVERPASIVKELVENSIDAKADEIYINVVSGGKDVIEVFDNGTGILKADLKKAVMPHATSKISKPSDLENISTLGFRGEALASISSVSKVRLTSKTEDEEIGYTLTVEGDNFGEVEEAPCNKGTFLTVQNVFFNTPARQKFLKSDRSEENEVTNTVARLILANPDVSFEYQVNNGTIYQSYGEGIEDALIAVYGHDIIRNCFKISNYVHGIKIEGYIGKHNYTKSSRSYQTVVLNGRYIENQTIQSAIHNAYSGYLMKRRYPFFVIYITMPSEIVDVNVTPNKSDVRFIDNSVIYGAIYSTISKVLDGTDTALDILSSPLDAVVKSPEAVRNEPKINIPKETHLVTTTSNPNTQEFYPKDTFSTNPYDYSLMREDANIFNEETQKGSEIETEKTVDIFAENKKYIEELEKKKLIQEEFEENKQLKLEYVGQVLRTYLIFEGNGDMYIIDQHAAHERLLFNKLLGAKFNVATQPLLVPFIIAINSYEYETILPKKDYLESLGIDLTINPGQIIIYALPTELIDIDLTEFFGEIFTDYELKREEVPEIIKEKLAQKACKSAIKAGMDLSQSEVDSLVKLLNGNVNLKCPHGRPIAVKITRTEIDKWFKRIV